MDIKKQLGKLIVVLSELQQKGQISVRIDALNRELEKINADSDQSSEQFKIRLVDHESYRSGVLEVFKSQITFAGSALKTLILVNGGAAVALLSLVGNLWSKTQTETLSVPEQLIDATALFSVGVLVGAVATGLAYLAQVFYGEAHYFDESSRERQICRRRGDRLRMATVACGILGLVLFGGGVINVYFAFHHHA